MGRSSWSTHLVVLNGFHERWAVPSRLLHLVDLRGVQHLVVVGCRDVDVFHVDGIRRASFASTYKHGATELRVCVKPWSSLPTQGKPTFL